MLMKSKPPNLQMIEDFSGELDKGGVHYTILSGISYVQFIVDQASELIQKPVPEVEIG